MNRAWSPSDGRHGNGEVGRRRGGKGTSFDESYDRFTLDKTTLIGDSVKDMHQSKYGKSQDGSKGGKWGTVRRLVRQLPIVGLLLLIGLGYYVYVYALCYAHLWRRKFYRIAVSYATGGHVLLIMLLWSFFKAAYSHPGYLSPHATQPADSPWSEWTVCPRCGKSRPPRAHHCSKCDVCVTKMGMCAVMLLSLPFILAYAPRRDADGYICVQITTVPCLTIVWERATKRASSWPRPTPLS